MTEKMNWEEEVKKRWDEIDCLRASLKSTGWNIEQLLHDICLDEKYETQRVDVKERLGEIVTRIKQTCEYESLDEILGRKHDNKCS